jgi:16S rRNA (uracil1498-N3)-methyltransferase
VAVDGRGTIYHATIAEIRPTEVMCDVASVEHLDEPNRIVLGVGVLKNPARLDYLVEKATELGVNEIVFLVTERSVSTRLKTGHWEKLALSAMKQSGRSHLPHIAGLASFGEFLKTPAGDCLKLIPHEQIASPSLLQVRAMHRHRSFQICIGPEGGFTEGEVGQAEDAGYHAVSLGPYRLRTETAAVTAVALCMGEMGDGTV